MATLPYGNYANLSRYQTAAAQPLANPLDSLIQGVQQGAALSQLPQTIQQNALNAQLEQALALQKLQQLQQPEIIKAGENLFVRDAASPTGIRSIFTGQATAPRASPFQFVGLGGQPESPSGIVFNPTTGQIETRSLPTGVSTIAPKVTQPPKTTSARGGLTANMQTTILSKAAASGIDPQDPKYTDEVTGTFDFTKLSIDSGKAALENKRTENALKAEGLTGKAKSDVQNLNAAEKQLHALQDTILEISATGKTPGFFDNAFAAVTAAPPGGFWGSFISQGADYLQSDDSKYLEGKKSVINSALTKAISGLAVSNGEAARLGFLPRPGESFESLVRKVGLVEDYINNQRAGLTEPVVSAPPSGGTPSPSPATPTPSSIRQKYGF